MAVTIGGPVLVTVGCVVPEHAISRRATISAITTARQRATRVEVVEFNNLINRDTLQNSPGTLREATGTAERFLLLAGINDIAEAVIRFGLGWTRECRQSYPIHAQPGRLRLCAGGYQAYGGQHFSVGATVSARRNVGEF